MARVKRLWVFASAKKYRFLPLTTVDMGRAFELSLDSLRFVWIFASRDTNHLQAIILPKLIPIALVTPYTFKIDVTRHYFYFHTYVRRTYSESIVIMERATTLLSQTRRRSLVQIPSPVNFSQFHVILIRSLSGSEPTLIWKSHYNISKMVL